MHSTLETISQPLVWLFTDFDGCLHPDRCPRKSQFSRMPYVERVLSTYPFLRVVVTSRWRLHRTSDALRELFPHPVRAQVAGGTPELPQSGPHQRYLEVQAYLEANRLAGAPWLILDDDPKLYPAECGAHMVAPDPRVGLDESTAVRLATLIERISQRARLPIGRLQRP